MNASRVEKVLIVALDGATPELVYPWARQGELPQIAQLLSRGAHGPLRSVLPPITGAAWTSFQTGVNPGGHGIFDWLTRKPDSYRLTAISSRSIPRTVLWEHLQEGGVRTGVISVPVSYPPRVTSGFMITDLLTPPDSNYAFPPSLRDQLEAVVGPYPLMPAHWRGRHAARAWWESLKASLRQRCDAAAHLMQTEPWDFLMIHLMEIDSVQHQMWHLLDGIPRPRYRALGVQGNPILEIHHLADQALGRFLQLAGPCTVLIISDHGFGPLHYNIYLNTWLLEKGYIALRRNPQTRLKKAAYRLGLTPERLYRWGEELRLLSHATQLRHDRIYDLLGMISLAGENIDWSQTRAYAYGNGGQLYVNRLGREPHGWVKPTEADRLIDSLRIELRSLTNHLTGERVFQAVYRKEEIYAGACLEQAPDILCIPREGYYTAGSSEFLANHVVGPTFAGSGWHKRDGIFIAAGPRIQPGELYGLQLIDLFPTILALYGLPIPPGIEGRAIAELFSQRESVRPSSLQAQDAQSPSSEAMTPMQEQSVRARLKGLGYL